jgi:putative phage-type endonuclease
MNAEAKNVIPAGSHDRRKYIGGSDIAAVLGISPWRSPVDLYTDKVAPPSDEPRRKRVFFRGERWESVVAEMLTTALEHEGHKVEIIGKNRRFVDATVPHFAAEIDFEVRLNDEPDITNVELKTVHPFKMREWGDSGSDTLPVWYTAQGMWGLGVAPGARKRCIVAPLFGADELRVFEILRDEETIAGMRERALAFWTNHVMRQVPPLPADVSDLNALFPTDDEKRPALIADSDLEDKWLRLRAIQAEIKAREAEFESLEFQMKRTLADCGSLVVDGKERIVWRTRKTSWLDQEGLKDAHPKLVKEFTRKGTARVFTVK